MIRDATANDAAAILALNEEFVHFTSPMSAARYEYLRAMSSFHRVIEEDGRVLAFLLAMREGSPYESPNYKWFSQRYDRFLYVDRIMVSGSAHGRGLGREMYQDIFSHARASGIPRITAEFYTTPPNEVSRRFHERFGFKEVGSQSVYETNVVSLQVAEV